MISPAGLGTNRNGVGLDIGLLLLIGLTSKRGLAVDCAMTFVHDPAVNG